MNPLVSVIVPTFNAGPFIARTLDSVLRQTYETMEIIVVDDGSTDDTVALVKSLGDAVKIVSQRNSGVCVARNTGVAASRGDLLAFLDADDLWEPGKIAAQVEVLRRHPDVGMVATDFDEIDSIDRALEREIKRPRHLFGRPIDLHRILLERGNFLSVSASMVRRKCFLDSGGFHSAERILSGDYDLWIRLSERQKFFIIPEIMVHYRILANSQIHGSLPKEYGAQRRILEMHRHRFTRLGYRLRMAQLHRDWADSALYEGEEQRWRVWRTAAALNPFSTQLWMLAAKSLARRLAGRPVDPLSE